MLSLFNSLQQLAEPVGTFMRIQVSEPEWLFFPPILPVHDEIIFDDQYYRHDYDDKFIGMQIQEIDEFLPYDDIPEEAVQITVIHLIDVKIAFEPPIQNNTEVTSMQGTEVLPPYTIYTPYLQLSSGLESDPVEITTDIQYVDEYERITIMGISDPMESTDIQEKEWIDDEFIDMGAEEPTVGPDPHDVYDSTNFGSFDDIYGDQLA